ncbi:glycoside hydrolase domain-containing protein, partial [Corynebacterium matruchotii]
MATVLDYSAGVPQAAAVRDAGYDGAVRYISPPRADWMRGKPIQRAEIDDFHVHGLDVAFVWQYGKEADSDV